MNTIQKFLRSEQSLCPFPQTGMQGGASMQGWGCQPAEIQGPWSHGQLAVTVQDSEGPSSSDNFLQLMKRRRGLPRRKVGQGRQLGQVALVSRFPAAFLATHPLPSRNQTHWPDEAAMWTLIGGLRAMATGGCLSPAHQPGPPYSPPSGQELRLCRRTGT